ncbi:MCP four helix bundle domain-containing protein [uncultured Aquitalea sp.]|uniref:MCP four helix bundle domain-containing protein n=1 Tax=uncultured Aquitalea sp. TaxID=540272 RepID=UPI0025D5F2F5|nr:MCP four helix bundle domain-containing protein [uncultured Aquitalea sp.]
MTVSKRILFQIALAVLALIGLAANGLYSQFRLAVMAQNFAMSDYPRLITLGRFSDAVYGLRLTGLHALTSTRDGDRKAAQADVKASYDAAKQAIGAYAGMINDDEDRGLNNKDLQLLDQYHDAQTPMLDAAARNDLKGARKLRTDSVTPAGDALRTNILAHIDYNKR